jgi:hypothetical protein
MRRLVLILFLATIASPAIAQDDPRFALVASFPNPTVSVQWDLNERFALRLDGAYSHRDSSGDDVTSGTLFTSLGGNTVTEERRTHTDSTTTSSSIGIAGLVTIHRDDKMRLYLSPRLLFGFNRQNTTQTVTESLSGNPTSGNGVIFGLPSSSPETVSRKDSSTSTGAGISFGAVSNVFERVALFGELGATYTRSNAPQVPTIGSLSLLSESTAQANSVLTRAVAGIMFRF